MRLHRAPVPWSQALPLADHQAMPLAELAAPWSPPLLSRARIGAITVGQTRWPKRPTTTRARIEAQNLNSLSGPASTRHWMPRHRRESFYFSRILPVRETTKCLLNQLHRYKHGKGLDVAGAGRLSRRNLLKDTNFPRILRRRHQDYVMGGNILRRHHFVAVKQLDL